MCVWNAVHMARPLRERSWSSAIDTLRWLLVRIVVTRLGASRCRALRLVPTHIGLHFDVKSAPELVHDISMPDFWTEADPMGKARRCSSCNRSAVCAIATCLVWWTKVPFDVAEPSVLACDHVENRRQPYCSTPNRPSTTVSFRPSCLAVLPASQSDARPSAWDKKAIVFDNTARHSSRRLAIGGASHGLFSAPAYALTGSTSSPKQRLDGGRKRLKVYSKSLFFILHTKHDGQQGRCHYSPKVTASPCPCIFVNASMYRFV